MFLTPSRKKKIQVDCPYCGHRQEEPAIGISTYCRECSEHFRIHRGVGLPDRGPRWSGVEWPEAEFSPAAAELEPEATEDADGEPETAEESAEETSGPDEKESGDSDNDGGTDEKGGDRGIGIPEEEKASWLEGLASWFGAGAPAPAPAPASASGNSTDGGAADGEVPSGDPPGERAVPADAADPLAGGSMKALIGELGDEERLHFGENPAKMPPDFSAPWLRRRWKDSEEEGREVRCFRCRHVQRVPDPATSTQCARCSVYISLADWKIGKARLFDLHTRGNVVVKRRGSVAGCELVCHNLECRGRIDAEVDCSGELVIRGDARIRGPVHCERLEVGRECEGRFPDGVVTGSAEIRGTLVGDLVCEGKAAVPKGGRIVGDVTAGEIETFGPEGITGRRTIDENLDASPPLNPAYNPAIIG